MSNATFSGAFDSGAVHEDLHRRTADHNIWMRERLMPAGGVMSGQATDDASRLIGLALADHRFFVFSHSEQIP